MITSNVLGNHISLPPKSNIDFEDYSPTFNVVAQVANIHDGAICNAIIDYAMREGITDVYLLDEEFVKTALINEVKRRKGGKGRHGKWESFEIPHMMRCSECGVSDLDIHRTKFAFCPYCGSKMEGAPNERGVDNDN